VSKVATTKIITVHNRMDHVLNYIGNIEKTENANFASLGNVLDYAADETKTVVYGTVKAPELKHFATGINCAPATAFEQMQNVMLLNDKPSPVVGYHIIQSFAPGETDAATAHKIGVKLAQRLWGDKFMVVVATHQNTECFHNHIALCPTSFIDGSRYHSCKESYYKLRNASDKLCREYGLSVIAQPESGRGKHYGQVRAEREGHGTWLTVIKSDVDESLEKATTHKKFYANLETLGYEVKLGKYLSVRPPGKERFVRLERNLGADYSGYGINRRIRANYPTYPVPKYRHSDFVPPKKPPFFARGSIAALYRHYLYLMGYYQQRGNTATNTRMHYLLREDIAKLDIYVEDTKLLGRESIEDGKQLNAYRDKCGAEIDTLTSERKSIYDYLYRHSTPEHLLSAKDSPRCQEINQRLEKLRHEVKQCNRIEERSKALVNRIDRIEHDEDKKLRPPENSSRQRSSVGRSR
jgi:hypothetical protein